jgi:hypothetical protein
VLKYLQSDPLTNRIKVIIHTSMRLDATDLERLRGAVGVISKERLGRGDSLAAIREMLDNLGAADTMAGTGSYADNHQR